MITHIKGDATKPQGEGVKIIAHVVNDIGAWGSGFVLAVSRRWPEPELNYRTWWSNRIQRGFGLGKIQMVQVEPDLWVCNMIAQHGIGFSGGKPPINYPALIECLEKLCAEAKILGATVHIPYKMARDRAGGSWDTVETFLINELDDEGVNVKIYELPEGAK